MIYYLILYLTFGLMMRLIGPMAKEFNREFIGNAWKSYFRIGRFAVGEKPKLYKILLAELLLSSLVVIIWPFFLIAFIPYYFRSKKRNKINKINKNNIHKTEDYFFLDSFKSANASGAGIIMCKNCFYQEEIVISTHGYYSNGNFLGYRGFQCQTCGKFHKLVNSKNDIEYFCDCGGQLSNELKVFCPRCKSINIEYSVKYMT